VVSEATSSDGFLAADDEPPHVVQLEVDPSEVLSAAVAEVEVRLSGRATDAGALERLVLTVGPEDAPAEAVQRWSRTVDDGHEGSLEVVWNGRDRRNVAVPTGTYRVELVAWDRAGASDVEFRQLEIIEVERPAAPTISAPGPGEMLPSGRARFSGWRPPGSSVRVIEDEEVTCQDEAGDGEEWSCSADAELPPGVHVVTAIASRATVDSPPSVPVTFVVLPAHPDSGPADAGGSDATCPDATSDCPLRACSEEGCGCRALGRSSRPDGWWFGALVRR